MVAPLDITAERYGRLIAIRRNGSIGRRTAWLFRCDCGKEVTLPLERVRIGYTRSCGCLRRDVTAARSTTHGHSRGYRRSPELRAWFHAKGRCYNQNDPKFPNYGGRGIVMCDEWRDDASAFLRDMGPRPTGTTLDRIDVNGPYSPENCRWATAAEQARNRTDNVFVELNGERMVLKDYAAATGQDYKRLSKQRRTAISETS